MVTIPEILLALHRKGTLALGRPNAVKCLILALGCLLLNACLSITTERKVEQPQPVVTVTRTQSM